MPVLHGHVEPTWNLKGMKGIAFAGIGHPEKFFNMLEEQGVIITEKVAFADHYTYTRSDIEKLIERGQPLLTTLKDAVKIDEDLRQNLTIVDIEFKLDNPAEWEKVISKEIK